MFLYGPFSRSRAGRFFDDAVAAGRRRFVTHCGEGGCLVMSLRGCVTRIRSGLLCVGFLAAALPAAAQDTPALEVSAGYSLLRVQRGFGVNLADVKETLNGWYAEAAATETDLLSLVGQGAGNYATVSGQKVKAYEFAAGPRFNRRSGGRTVFGQFLIGVAHYRPHGPERSTNATLHLGGGVSLGPSDRVGFRICADYERIFTGGSNLLS